MHDTHDKQSYSAFITSKIVACAINNILLFFNI